MPNARRLLTNFSKGEGSPLLEGRPDLESYFELGSYIQNFTILRQGGLTRRVGTRFVNEVKFINLDTILMTFEASVGDTYILEIGDHYIRFYTDKELIAFEVSTPYTVDHIRNLHSTQSVDIMYFFHSLVAQHKLARVTPTSWVLSEIQFSPPPTFEDDHDISGGTVTLTPSAISGSNVLFTASAAVFLEGDVGRLIISGIGVAEITSFGASAGDTASPNNEVRCTIRDAFASTSPIPAGSWFLRLSPVALLDPNIKAPVNAAISLTASVPSFRTSDVGKYIAIYGGLVHVTTFISSTVVHGVIQTELSVSTDADPDPTGAWSLETKSWGNGNGFPRTGEFHQGRLGQASTLAEPNVFWLSRSDDFENYATGIAADDAIAYAVATKQLNRIEWLADNKQLFLGTMGSEHTVASGNSDDVLGGDQIPLVERIASIGSAPIQPIVIGNRIVFVDRSYHKVWASLYNIEEDGQVPVEITAFAEHITESGIKPGPIAFSQNPDPQLYFVRNDGILLCLTYYFQEKVIGFTRITTEGLFESVAVRKRSGQSDQVWVVVLRIINGVNRRFVEVFDADAEELAFREWISLQTDCAKLYTGFNMECTGLGYLEGKTVDVIVDGSVHPQRVVTGGMITLDWPSELNVEVGLHYDSIVSTMRPTIDGQMLEGVPRNWIQLWARLFKTIGGKLNGDWILYPFDPLNTKRLYTGDVQLTPQGNYDTDGRLVVVQDQPYPMTLLALFGEISFGEHT